MADIIIHSSSKSRTTDENTFSFHAGDPDFICRLSGCPGYCPPLSDSYDLAGASGTGENYDVRWSNIRFGFNLSAEEAAQDLTLVISGGGAAHGGIYVYYGYVDNPYAHDEWFTWLPGYIGGLGEGTSSFSISATAGVNEFLIVWKLGFNCYGPEYGYNFDVDLTYADEGPTGGTGGVGGIDIGFHYPIATGATGATACIPCEEESKFTLISSSYGPIY